MRIKWDCGSAKTCGHLQCGSLDVQGLMTGLGTWHARGFRQFLLPANLSGHWYVRILSAQRQSASAAFIEGLFGQQFDLWISGPRLRCVRQGPVGRRSVDDVGHPALPVLIQESIASGTAQCRVVANSLICAVPVMTDQGPGAAVGSLTPAQAAQVMQHSMNLAMLGERAASEVEAESDCSAPDRRLRADLSELNWLNQLPGSVVPRSDDVSVRSTAGRILPELRGLVQARSLLLVTDSPNAAMTAQANSVIWKSGDVVNPEAIDRLLQQHRAEAAAENGLCLNFTIPALSRETQGVILAAVMVPVPFPGGQSGWLIAVNKDLRRLASGQAAGRYGTDIGAGDVEFGEAEISLMRAASSVLTTNSGIMGLLHDREQLLTGVVRTLVNALDAKDSYTCGHSDRVAEFARLTAQVMGVDSQGCERIHMAGLLHDIGKVGVPDEILKKPGGVTDEEMAVIRRHPEIGYQILKHLSSFEYVLPGVLHHHEAFDGSGYPHQLKGTDIPLSARIISVADAWDAMTSDRSYRVGMTAERAIEILTKGAGTQWDPRCVTAFLKCMEAVRLRMDEAHTELAAPRMVRPAAVATMAHWAECFAQSQL